MGQDAQIERLRAEHTLAVEMLKSAEKECAELRAEVERLTADNNTKTERCEVCQNELLDHAELRAEVERLRATIVGADREIKASHADGDRLRAEIARLAAQKNF